jgi:LacI family transcriptional regulator, repressor for deo operon, udp, cdd, tsx, nupC, and nupG
VAASIGDVAARAGVSVATVSRALRGLPNVAPSTRARVLEAAEALRYVADPHASRLAAGRTRTIGIVVPLFTQWYYTQVVSGAEAVVASAGYDVLLYCMGGDSGLARFLQTLPFRKRVDGLMLIDLPLADEQEAVLAGTSTPVVLVGVRSRRFPSVVVDNVGAAAQATQHLLNLGHEHVALIGHEPGSVVQSVAPIERQQGYRQALKAAGLPLLPEHDVPGGFSLQGGAEAMAQLLTVGTPPTAVFAESDEMAIGALKTLRDSGLRAPEDVSVIGFDDHDMAPFMGLTTIAQPVVALGEVAAQLLIDAGTAEPPGPTTVELATKLRVRTTTGPPRGRWDALH